MPKTLDIEECAALLKVNRTTALELAGKGIVPGAKIGRAWVFIEDDVLNYLRLEVERQAVERRRATEHNYVARDPDSRRKPLPRLPPLPKDEKT